jgi:hypothetical protein
MPGGGGGVKQPELQEPNQLPGFSEAFAVASVMFPPSTARRVFTAVKDEDVDFVAWLLTKTRTLTPLRCAWIKWLTMLSSVNENQDIAMVDPTGAQSIMLLIRFVIANLELESLPSRDEFASGLLKMVSFFGTQPPQSRGSLTFTVMVAPPAPAIAPLN